MQLELFFVRSLWFHFFCFFLAAFFSVLMAEEFQQTHAA